MHHRILQFPHSAPLRRRILLMVLAVATTSCVSAADVIRRDHESIKNQAAFNWECPKDDITLVNLDTSNSLKNSTRYGVSGCGHRATYVYASGVGWVANSRSE